jgi:hypothetical protein
VNDPGQKQLRNVLIVMTIAEAVVIAIFVWKLLGSR